MPDGDDLSIAVMVKAGHVFAVAVSDSVSSMDRWAALAAWVNEDDLDFDWHDAVRLDSKLEELKHD